MLAKDKRESFYRLLNELRALESKINHPPFTNEAFTDNYDKCIVDQWIGDVRRAVKAFWNENYKGKP